MCIMTFESAKMYTKIDTQKMAGPKFPTSRHRTESDEERCFNNAEGMSKGYRRVTEGSECGNRTDKKQKDARDMLAKIRE